MSSQYGCLRRAYAQVALQTGDPTAFLRQLHDLVVDAVQQLHDMAAGFDTAAAVAVIPRRGVRLTRIIRLLKTLSTAPHTAALRHDPATRAALQVAPIIADDPIYKARIAKLRTVQASRELRRVDERLVLLFDEWSTRRYLLHLVKCTARLLRARKRHQSGSLRRLQAAWDDRVATMTRPPGRSLAHLTGGNLETRTAELTAAVLAATPPTVVTRLRHLIGDRHLAAGTLAGPVRLIAGRHLVVQCAEYRIDLDELMRDARRFLRAVRRLTALLV